MQVNSLRAGAWQWRWNSRHGIRRKRWVEKPDGPGNCCCDGPSGQCGVVDGVRPSGSLYASFARVVSILLMPLV